jgi:hypothetical protein
MRERASGIGELNESSLHARLKALYLEEGAASEVRVGRYVADVLLADGRVVEVQTGHLYSLKPKLATPRGATCCTAAAPPSGARC